MVSRGHSDDPAAIAGPARAADVESWLDVLIENSPVGMAVISAAENRCVRVNAALAELYGMSVEEISNADPFSLAVRVTHPDDLEREQQLFAELVAGTRSVYRVEKRYVRPDGTIRWGLLTFSAIYDEASVPTLPVGSIRFVVLQVIDVTDERELADTVRRREAELEHAQKVDGIGRLAAGIAHDFNNLLTVIVGYGELLKRLVESDAALTRERIAASVEPILAAAQSGAGLTAQVLAYGRREIARPGVLSLSSVVETAQRLLAQTLGPNVTLESSLTARGVVFADGNQVGQVVINLVLNARDALPEGGRISVETRDVQGTGLDGTPEGEWVALVVTDTGQGMTDAVRERMFEPFFTTRSGRPGTSGTGLGLATVKRIVLDLGGQLEVDSVIGEGTTVTVLFPVATDGRKEGELRRDPLPLALRANSHRILVVEDDPSVRSLVGSLLLGAGYLVTVARDPAEALEFVQRQAEPFDVVVTDIVMPGESGVAFAERIRRMGVEAPVLFISGFAGEAPRFDAAFLHKPFTPVQLLRAVEDALLNSMG